MRSFFFNFDNYELFELFSINQASQYYDSNLEFNKILNFIPMTDIKKKKENVKIHLKDLRQNLKKMHLKVTEELLIPQPEDVKRLMHKMDQLLKLIESN